MGVVSLIVMEPGSRWPGHVGDSENVVAAGCDAEGLLQRTRHMVEALRGRRTRVRVAVLACNDATDVGSSGRRAEIARELLNAVAPVTLGRLLLCASESASTHLRLELMSLADRLGQSLQGTTATVSLRFGGADDGPVASEPRLMRTHLPEWATSSRAIGENS
jgi:hypothetical protein